MVLQHLKPPPPAAMGSRGPASPMSAPWPVSSVGHTEEAWALLRKLEGVPILLPHQQSPRQNVLTWLGQIQYKFDLHRLHPQLWVIAALQFLSKDIRAHYEISYTPAQLREMPWTEFARQLRERYLPADMGARLAGALDNLRQEPDEFLSQFVTRTKTLVRQLRTLPGGAEFAGDSVVTQRFLKGVRSSTVRTLLRAWMADKPPNIGLDPLLEYALKLCTQQDSGAQGRDRRLTVLTAANSPPPRSRSKGPGHARGDKAKPSTTPDGGTKAVPKCKYCGRRGHSIDECRKRAKRATSSDGRTNTRSPRRHHPRSRQGSEASEHSSTGDASPLLPPADISEITVAPLSDDEDLPQARVPRTARSSHEQTRSSRSSSRVRFEQTASYRAGSPGSVDSST